MLAAAVSPLAAQAPPARKDSARADRTFFTRRDAIIAAAGVAGSALVSVFDESIADWWRRPGIQGSDGRHDVIDNLSTINEVPLTLGAFAVYGVGRLVHAKGLTDAALHTGEALVLTVIASEAIRVPLGRARPRRSPEDQYLFKAGAGWNQFEFRSYPSIHAAAAFSAASAVAAELSFRAPAKSRYINPILFAAATVPGFTRMYLDQHWASDVVAGTVLGAVLGNKVVRYAHSHRQSRLDRVMMGTTIVPDGRGGFLVAVAITPP